MRLWIIVVAVFVIACVAAEVSAKTSKRDVDLARSNANKHKRVDGSHRSKNLSYGHKKKGKTTKDAASTKDRKRRSTEAVTSESSAKEFQWNERDQRKGREARSTTKKEKSFEETGKTVEETVPEKLYGESKKNRRIDEKETATAAQTPARSQRNKEQKKSKPDLERDAHCSDSSYAFEKDSSSTVNYGKTSKKEKYSTKSKNPEGNVNDESDKVQEQKLKSSGGKLRDDSTIKSKRSLETENADDFDGEAVPEDQHHQHSTDAKQQKSNKVKHVQKNDMANSDKLASGWKEFGGRLEKSVRAEGKKRSDVLPEETWESSEENEETVPRVQKKNKKSKTTSQKESQEGDELSTAESKSRAKRGDKFGKSACNDEISEKKNRKKSSKYSAKTSGAENTDGEQKGARKMRVKNSTEKEYKKGESDVENEKCSSEEDSLFEDVLSKSCTAR